MWCRFGTILFYGARLRTAVQNSNSREMRATKGRSVAVVSKERASVDSECICKEQQQRRQSQWGVWVWDANVESDGCQGVSGATRSQAHVNWTLQRTGPNLFSLPSFCGNTTQASALHQHLRLLYIVTHTTVSSPIPNTTKIQSYFSSR